jgi:hypothetical protein
MMIANGKRSKRSSAGRLESFSLTEWTRARGSGCRPLKSGAFARQAQRRFARPANDGLENAGSVCHDKAEIFGGVP